MNAQKPPFTDHKLVYMIRIAYGKKRRVIVLLLQGWALHAHDSIRSGDKPLGGDILTQKKCHMILFCCYRHFFSSRAIGFGVSELWIVPQTVGDPRLPSFCAMFILAYKSIKTILFTPRKQFPFPKNRHTPPSCPPQSPDRRAAWRTSPECAAPPLGRKKPRQIA